MATWLFVVTFHKLAGRTLSPEDVLRTRFDDGFWGLGEKTPNRKSLKKGDDVVFYLGNPTKAFAASATLASDSYALDNAQREKYGHDLEFFKANYGVLLENCRTWDRSVSVVEVVDNLSFIENKENWGAYFQGGVRQLTPADHRTLFEGRDRTLTEKIREEEDIESQSEFALEAHLEEFIDQNWGKISFGDKLVKVKVDEQDGRQFPAGQWSIDFLCRDADSGDMVVIELKKGKTSDATVGQLLRYIGWVQENFAEPGQKTRGIIIANNVDDALRLAVRNLPNVKILTYRVDFHLKASV